MAKVGGVHDGGMHGRGACVTGGMCGKGCVWQGGMCGKGVYMVRGMCGRSSSRCSGQYASYWNAFVYYIRTIVFLPEAVPVM